MLVVPPVAVALIALHRPATQRLERAVEPVLPVLHRLGSDNVGDYVASMLLGIAALGALVVPSG